MGVRFGHRCKNFFTTLSFGAVREDVMLIVRLLEINKDWQKTQYVWYHPSGVSLWVANLNIGISVKWNTNSLQDYHAIYQAGKWRLNRPEVRLVKRAMTEHHVSEDEQKVRDVAAKILKMYG